MKDLRDLEDLTIHDVPKNTLQALGLECRGFLQVHSRRNDFIQVV